MNDNKGPDILGICEVEDGSIIDKFTIKRLKIFSEFFKQNLIVYN